MSFFVFICWQYSCVFKPTPKYEYVHIFYSTYYKGTEKIRLGPCSIRQSPPPIPIASTFFKSQLHGWGMFCASFDHDHACSFREKYTDTIWIPKLQHFTLKTLFCPFFKWSDQLIRRNIQILDIFDHKTDIFDLQKGLDYRTHLNTERFEVQISNGW